MVTLRKRKAAPEASASTGDSARPSKKAASSKRVKKSEAPGKKASDKTPTTKSSKTQIKASTARQAGAVVNASKTTGQEMFWLMKAEPEPRLKKGVDVSFSIDDLAAASKPEPWDGVRNPVARNVMRDMHKGDLAFFYHSNCKVPGIAGIMRIVQEATPDVSAHDPKHPYYDPKDSAEKPKWVVVHVEFVRKFERLISLKELQSFRGPGQQLEDLQTFRQTRLSVSKVTPQQWDFILGLLEEKDE